MTKGEIHKNLWEVTTAYVVCSRLMMPAGDFDEHIAGVISEDYSKFHKCYDRIKSIMDLNTRTDRCVLFCIQLQQM